MNTRLVSGALLGLAVLTSSALADGRKPGSVLVYPVHRSGGQFVTVINITNSNLTPVSGTTNVHFEYANVIPDPANAFCPTGCVIFDRVEKLTPADTKSVLTSFHNATFGAGQEGYLVCSAENPALFDTPWSHNYLMGSALVVNGSGGMYSVNAIPFESPAADGAPTDSDNDGQLDFDGVEYEGTPDVLYVDSFVAFAGSRLSLTSLTGGPTAKNTVMFQIWNDNEFLLSTTLTFKCWFDQPLTAISPLFSNSFLANNTPDDPTELDLTGNGQNDVETGWARIDSVLVTTAGGSIIDSDGAMLGTISAGPGSVFDGGHLLWESNATQTNGQFISF